MALNYLVSSKAGAAGAYRGSDTMLLAGVCAPASTDAVLARARARKRRRIG